jgi:flagellar biogenesis protein FliO
MVIGLASAFLCALAFFLTPGIPLYYLAAHAADAVKQGKEATPVEDTKIKDNSEQELPLIDPDDSAAADAGTGAPAKEDLGHGVTATGKAGKDGKQDGVSAGKTRAGAPSVEIVRFQLQDRRQELSLSAKADRADLGVGKKSVAKASAKPAKPKVNAAQNKATKATAVAKPAAKPAPKPVSKPIVKAAPKARPKIALHEEPVVETPGAGIVDELAQQEIMPAMPETTTVPPTAPPASPASPTLKQLFTNSELASDDSDSTVMDQPVAGGSVVTEDAPDTHSDLYAGVIHTQGGNGSAGTSPPIGAALRDGKNNGVGSNLVTISPWRAVSMVLLVLALLFAGAWAAGKFKGVLPGSAKRSLAVIESITLAPGRQITIVELHGEVLVLGITPQSINLLDKLPLDRLSEDYSSTVQTIINRETTALPAEWAKQPAFVAGTHVPRLSAPAPRAFVPPPRERVSVGELRRARGFGGGASMPPPVRSMAYNARGVPYAPPVAAAGGSGARASKDELISRLHSQLRDLEG